jgi:hypothetical protein
MAEKELCKECKKLIQDRITNLRLAQDKYHDFEREFLIEQLEYIIQNKPSEGRWKPKSN